MTYAYPKMTHAGLCNLLFVWAKAAVYCHQTGALMLAPDWGGAFRIGPWLRRERYKRYYVSNFQTKGCVTGWRRWKLLHLCASSVRVFSGMGEWFDPLLQHQAFISEALRAMTRPEIVSEVDALGSDPFIAVHVRRSDFAQAGYLTGDDWFVRGIRRALQLVPSCRQIKVFSDGDPETMKFIIQAFPVCQVQVMNKAKPMRDLLLMSKSQVLVASARSTFSMWAVFLGQMPSVWAPLALQEPHRLYVDDNCDMEVVS